MVLDRATPTATTASGFSILLLRLILHPSIQLLLLFSQGSYSFPMQSVPTTDPLILPSSHEYSLVGRSRAGDGTTFIIPELRWMFDCGSYINASVKGSRIPNVIFLTHTHSDHIFTVAQICYSRQLEDSIKKRKRPLPIYLPADAVPYVCNYLKSYSEMITMGGQDETVRDDDNNNEQNYELIGVVPNQELSIKQGGKEFLVKVLECVHRVSCVGYSIFEYQQKLKEEYRGLAGKDIGALKKSGIQITSKVQHPILCYLGDTTVDVFHRHPEILQEHTVIVVECTFLDDDVTIIANAKRTKHMHWNDLKSIVVMNKTDESNNEDDYNRANSDGNNANNNTILFVLIHFSLRYPVLHLRSFFNTYTNVHPMIVQSELQHEWDLSLDKLDKEKKKRNSKQQQYTSASYDDDDNNDNNHINISIINGHLPPSCNCFACKNHSAARNTKNQQQPEQQTIAK